MKGKLFILLLFVVNVSYSQNGNGYDYQFDESTPQVVVESSEDDCVRARESVNGMTETRQELLRDCMMDYLDTGDNYYWKPGDPLWEQNSIVEEHYDNQTAWHNLSEIGFFTGHRDYIQDMEQFMLQDPGCVQFVPLPAFDPNTPVGGDDPSGRVPDLFWNGESLVDGFPANNGTQQVNLDQIVVNSETCDEFPSIDAFAGQVEREHGGVHVVTGGSGGVMSNINLSPGNALFFLWHAYVDDQYSCWQSICQGCDPAFVQSIFSRDKTKICFDLSRSTNVDDFTFELLDDDGIAVNYNIGPDQCIDYEDLPICRRYTIKIKGTNGCDEDLQGHSDEISHTFFNNGRVTKFGNPCVLDTPWATFNRVVVSPNKVTYTLSPAQNTGSVRLSLINMTTGNVRNIGPDFSYQDGIIPELNFSTTSLGIGNYSIIAEREGEQINYNINITR